MSFHGSFSGEGTPFQRSWSRQKLPARPRTDPGAVQRCETDSGRSKLRRSESRRRESLSRRARAIRDGLKAFHGRVERIKTSVEAQIQSETGLRPLGTLKGAVEVKTRGAEASQKRVEAENGPWKPDFSTWKTFSASGSVSGERVGYSARVVSTQEARYPQTSPTRSWWLEDPEIWPSPASVEKAGRERAPDSGRRAKLTARSVPASD